MASSVLEWLSKAANAVDRALASEEALEWAGGIEIAGMEVEIGEASAELGWYIPAHPALYSEALKERPAAETVQAWWSPRGEYWPGIRDALGRSEVLASRRDIIDDALFCIEHERWAAAICTMLPIIEGLISERVEIYEGMRVGRRLDELLNSAATPRGVLAPVTFLDSVIDKEVFEDRRDLNPAFSRDDLHRHWALHARIGRFGTETNALRCLSILGALVELLDGPLHKDADDGWAELLLTNEGVTALLARHQARERRSSNNTR